MTPLVEGYFYHGLDSVRAIKISENGSDFYTLTLASTGATRDALAAWQVLANAHGSLSNTYAFAWSAGVVT